MLLLRTKNLKIKNFYVRNCVNSNNLLLDKWNDFNQILRELGTNNETVIDWNNYKHEVCNWRVQQTVVGICSAGLTVEKTKFFFLLKK